MLSIADIADPTACHVCSTVILLLPVDVLADAPDADHL
jgi:hypothetical protein